MMKMQTSKIPLRKWPEPISIGLVTLCNVKRAYTSQDLMISHDGNKVSMKEKREGRKGRRRKEEEPTWCLYIARGGR